jgi:hypothetical protein
LSSCWYLLDGRGILVTSNGSDGISLLGDLSFHLGLILIIEYTSVTGVEIYFKNNNNIFNIFRLF